MILLVINMFILLVDYSGPISVCLNNIMFYCIISVLAIKTGSLIIEGKTKRILEIIEDSDNVLMVSKDRITAGDGAKAHDMEGKSVISTATTAKIFEYLNEVGMFLFFYDSW